MGIKGIKFTKAKLTQSFSQAHVDWVYSSHGLHQVFAPKLNLNCPLWLQHSTSADRNVGSHQEIKLKTIVCSESNLPAVLVSVHLHVTGVDGGINDHPRASSQLCLWGDINQHRLLVLPQSIHNVGPELQHLVVHICKEGLRFRQRMGSDPN